jgi:hypothetical protein
MEELAVKNVSNVNWLALVFLAVMSLVVLRSNRQKAVIAVLLTALLVPLGQQFVILGLHFRFYRLLIFVGMCRLMSRGEGRGFRLTGMDKLLIAWTLVTVVCGVIRGPKAETFGNAYDVLGTYFLFRVWMEDAEDSIAHLRVLAVAVLLVAVCMSQELVTHRNLFSVFGGVPDTTFERDGRFRCQGPFRHPILAGTFAATLFPLMVGLWFQDRSDRKRALVGLIACGFCTYATASSGPLMTFMAAIIGFGLWPMRYRMRLIRRGLLATLIGLALVMNAPIWYLIARLSDLTGGTGWHRSYLIDQAVKHFNEWWLVGSSYTAHWAEDQYTVLAVDPDNMDITNHYIAQGLQGGLLGLGLFIAIIVCGFKNVGSVVTGRNGIFHEPKVWWLFGVSLCSHCVAFISVSYFDQIQVFWFWLLAVLATLQVTANKRLAANRLLQSAEDPDREHLVAASG